jgi:nitrate/nitrite transport system ATP-binding protein
MEAATPFLDLRAVSKGYGPRALLEPVLRDIDLRVEQGEIVAVVGCSGSGKTTLLSLVAGLLVPDQGEVRLAGVKVERPGPDMGVVFQNYSLLPWLTAAGNVLLAVEQVFAGWTRERRLARVHEMLSLVGLANAGAKLPRELSGGMRQRVAIARALAVDPKILLLDEPLGALDALTRANLQTALIGICAAAAGKTMLLITNDVDEALLLADRVVPLSAGPGATLGPAVTLPVPRPRERRALAGDPRFKRARNELIEWLLGPGRRRLRQAEARPPLRGVEVTA